MKVEKNKMVSVTYELRTGNKNGEIVETADKTKPLKFPYGENMLLPLFEAELLDKEVGDTFEIEIDAANGYGVVNDYMIVDIPKTVFMVDGVIDNLVIVGNRLPMMTDGYSINGSVVSIDDTNVKMDFNHPLAGKDLYFKGEIVDVRDLTDAELHGDYGNTCKCNDDCDCDEDCGDDCECKK